MKIKEVFDTFDVDKTGLLSLQDLKMQITTLGMEDEARAIYDVLTDLDIVNIISLIFVQLAN